MRFIQTALCIITATVASQCVCAQPAVFDRSKLLLNDSYYSATDSGLVIYRLYRNSCKNIFYIGQPVADSMDVLLVKGRSSSPDLPKTKFLTVHGNVAYNFFYRSQIDTPFAQQNVMQHQVQTTLNMMVKEKYPVRLVISNRNSNSPYFNDATEMNMQFNKNYLLDNIKKQLKEKAAGMVTTEVYEKLQQQYKDKLQEASQLKEWVNSPARLQEQVEERESALRKSLPGRPVLPSANTGEWLPEGYVGKFKKKAQDKLMDSLKDLASQHSGQPLKADSSKLERYKEKKEQLAKLEKEVKETVVKINKQKKLVTDSINTINREINSLRSAEGLYAFMKKRGISKNELTKAEKLLLTVNQVGIGRTWVDYSELTVKNISLGGINAEANPSPYYVAFAAGKVNYRFRDFILKDNKALPNQSLFLVRGGLGKKDKNSLIFTFYNGKKSVLNYSGTGAAENLQRVLGFSAETRVALDENNYLVAEFAKSSFQNAGSQEPSSSLIGKAFNWKINSNQAYSVKLFSQYPQTNTKLMASYKKMGERFQSFNLFPTNTEQEAYTIKLNQPLWKKRIVIDAGIRKNDFESPIAAPAFSSKTVFKSLQLSARIPKLPFVSVGYFPSSQLSFNNNNLLVENRYNMLNAMSSYSYIAKGLSMNTNALFTRFYNNSSDTGFIYYNSSSYTINHSFYLAPFSLQASASVIDQENLRMLTLEPLLSYQYKNILTLSGSVKWNRLNNESVFWGGTGAVGVTIKKLGTIQLNYDKTYLPTHDARLRPVDIGRASFYREF